jgi:hypothetical protein
MTFKSALHWSTRPKRIGVLIAKLLLAGSTDLAAQTVEWRHSDVRPMSQVCSSAAARRSPGSPTGIQTSCKR